MTDYEVNLTNCDKEPIHIPGAVQPHGCLLACDASLENVVLHSVNAPAALGLDDTPLAGRSFSAVVGAKLAHEIRNGLAKCRDPRRPALMFGCALREGSKAFDISAHRFQDRAIVELEPAVSPDLSVLDITRTLIARTQSIADLQDLFKSSARLIRAMLSYDRVMIYRFAADGSGKVIAEERRADLESFLGQHFPATDIPAQARVLYLRNIIRVIGDASGPIQPIAPVEAERAAPLDMSYAHLRSVSPIHLEYLRNMGVAASMSVSIVVQGALWGLIACHHYAPKVLSLSQRAAMEIFAEMLALRIDSIERAETLASATRVRVTLEQILSETTAKSHVADVLADRLDTLKTLMPCDGVALFCEGRWYADGTAPDAATAARLAAFLKDRASGRVWRTSALSRDWPEATAFSAIASGVLAIPLSQTPRDYLFFFRREQVETIEWGGDPNKSYTSGPNGDRLTPRKSFEIWKEVVHEQSAPWTAIDLEAAESARVQLLEIMMRHSEALMEERREAEVRQKTLNEELNHRVKNILALIKSLVSQDVRQEVDVAEYAATLKGRIVALSNAHDQVVRSDGGGPLAGLLRAELGPYAGQGREVRIEGPHVVLNARSYSVLALVLHELATNAAKYGSLSSGGGRLDATWSILPKGDCEILWRESGGPAVTRPSRTGFGTTLIKRSVPFDLGGESRIEYLPEGLLARLTVPMRFFECSVARDAVREAAPEVVKTSRPLQGYTALLVEDQFVIALEAENLLTQAGVETLHIAATVEEAERLLAEEAPDFAILDINLGVGSSLPIAVKLKRLRIPFLFATGYGDSRMIPPDLSSVPVVRKPYEGEDLVKGVEAAIRQLSDEKL